MSAPQGDAPDPGFDLAPLLDPRVIGVVGASQRPSRGTTVVQNLQRTGFTGSIRPINPKYDEVLGLPCFPSAGDVPETIDCLVVAIPAPAVPGLLAKAKDDGVRSAVVLSSGFREAGSSGELHHDALERLALAGLPICGPNCYGILNLATGAAAFSGHLPDPIRTGDLAFVSQSGSFTNAVVNPLIEDRALGFKYMISCGNAVGPRIEDYLTYLVDDPEVRVVGCFVEQFSSPSAVIAVGRTAGRLGKSVVVLKAGRSDTAQRAVRSHTGSIAGSSRATSALLEKAGIIEAASLDELAEMLALLAAGDSARIGRRVIAVTGAGGEASQAADAAERAGIVLPKLGEETSKVLRDGVLPYFGHPSNPLDGTGVMFEDVRVFPAMLEAVCRDPSADVVAVNIGQRPSGPKGPGRRFASQVAELPEELRRRIVAYGAMGVGPIDRVFASTLRAAGVPFVAGTDHAMRAIAAVAARNESISAWASEEIDDRAANTVAWPREPSGMTPAAAWGLLDGAGIPIPRFRLAADESEAVSAADRLGYPVAIKTTSPVIAHKTDVGGVALWVDSPQEARNAYRSVVEVAAGPDGADMPDVIVQEMAGSGVELLVGAVRHDGVGPAVVVAFGGLLADVLEDSVVAIPPLGRREAAGMLQALRGHRVLKGLRGSKPSDVQVAVDVIRAMGRLACAMPDWVEAIDLNPVIVHEEGRGATCVDIWIETKRAPEAENAVDGSSGAEGGSDDG